MARTSGPDSVDYDDSSDELITGEAVALDLRPTGFALRAAGTIIDAILYLSVYIGALILMFTLVGSGSFDPAIAGILSIVVLVLMIVVAPITVETATRGKSLGRLAVGARIVRDDGGAITLRHAFIRGLIGLFELYLTLGGIAALVGLLNRRSKRLGDLLAGTYSQYERAPKLVAPTFGVPAVLLGWAQTADVARLPATLSRRLAQFLAQAPKFTPDRRVYMARALATETARFVSPVPNVDAELFIAAVVVLRREREARALQLEREGLARLDAALTTSPHGFPDRG